MRLATYRRRLARIFAETGVHVRQGELARLAGRSDSWVTRHKNDDPVPDELAMALEKVTQQVGAA